MKTLQFILLAAGLLSFFATAQDPSNCSPTSDACFEGELEGIYMYKEEGVQGQGFHSCEQVCALTAWNVEQQLGGGGSEINGQTGFLCGTCPAPAPVDTTPKISVTVGATNPNASSGIMRSAVMAIGVAALSFFV